MSLSLYILVFLEISHSATCVEQAAECHMVYDKYDHQAATSRNFLFGEVWPNNEIPFVISPGFSSSDLDIIHSAMRHVESNVCVKWIPRRNQTNYVYIKHDKPGCFAALGYNRFRGRHELNLQRSNGRSTCMIKGVAAHEMLHILGFAHEHTRADRDQYVKVHWTLIKRATVSNFFRNIEVGSHERPPICDRKSTQKSFDDCYSGLRTSTFGMPYDYGSIMHYHLKAFTTTGSDTMSVLAPVPLGVVIGNRKAMTQLDAQKAQAKYGCNGKTTTTKKPSLMCRDIYVQCQEYKSLCGSNKMITDGCPVSCGACKECYDKYSNCPDFKHLCGGNDEIDNGCHFTCRTC